MTTYSTAEVTCSVCHTSVSHNALASTNEFGSRDLDLRPAEMMRSTMGTWVQQCPKCGLCAASLDHAPQGAAEGVQTSEYRAVLHGPSRMPKLARQFRAEALLTERAGQLATAANRALCAAWACDDAGEAEAAVECRTLAIGLFVRASGGNGRPAKDVPEPDTLNLLLTDLLRRTGRFDEARARCEMALHTKNDVMRAVARFQRALIDKADTAVHRIEEAVRN